MSASAVKETTVTEGHAASIPASIRTQLGIEPGDKLVWTAEGDRILVRVKKRRQGAFEDFEPYDLGEPTNATADHDEVH